MSLVVTDANGAKQTILTAADIIAALAPLATDADVQAGVAKMEAVRALLAAVLTVQGTVTANLGTTNGLGLDSSLSAIKAALGTPAQTADVAAVLAQLKTTLAVALPAGAAKDATLAAIATALGSPLQAGGTVVTAPAGLGAMQAVPAGSINGTALGTAPAGAKGARLYLPSGASVTFTIASAAPTAAPAVTFTVSASGSGPNWDEDLAGGMMVYVTATAGSPLFRWY